MSFVYSIKTLFQKIAYYLSRLSRALKLTSCSQKTYAFLNVVEKYVRLNKKKKVNIIKLSLICWHMSECAYINRILNVPGVQNTPKL